MPDFTDYSSKNCLIHSNRFNPFGVRFGVRENTGRVF